jgi:hypothetical protein
MNRYDKQTEFAQTLGFKTPALAIISLGKYKFMDDFKLWELKNYALTVLRIYEVRQTINFKL